MRRKSTRNTQKSTPEKSVKERESTPKTRRSRRRKRSPSKSSESEEEIITVTKRAPPEETPDTTTKSHTPTDEEASEEPVWKVTSSEGSPKGEIQKLKICLTRPSPDSPEKSKIRRSKSNSQTEDDATSSEDKSTRRTRSKGSPFVRNDGLSSQEGEDDVEEKKGKGKSKGKHKSKIEKSPHLSEPEIQTNNEISENVQVTPQSPSIDKPVDNENDYKVDVDDIQNVNESVQKHDSNNEESATNVGRDSDNEDNIKVTKTKTVSKNDARNKDSDDDQPLSVIQKNKNDGSETTADQQETSSKDQESFETSRKELVKESELPKPSTEQNIETPAESEKQELTTEEATESSSDKPEVILAEKKSTCENTTPENKPEVEPQQESASEEVEPQQESASEEVEPEQEKAKEKVEPQQESITQEVEPEQESTTQEVEPQQETTTKEVESQQETTTQEVELQQETAIKEIEPTAQEVEPPQESTTPEAEPVPEISRKEVEPPRPKRLRREIEPQQERKRREVEPPQERKRREVEAPQERKRREIEPPQARKRKEVEPQQERKRKEVESPQERVRPGVEREVSVESVEMSQSETSESSKLGTSKTSEERISVSADVAENQQNAKERAPRRRLKRNNECPKPDPTEKEDIDKPCHIKPWKTKHKWEGDTNVTPSLMKIDLESIQVVWPTIDFPEEPDLNVEIEKERRKSATEFSTKKLERKVSVEYKSDVSERPPLERQVSVSSTTQESEDNSNIIAFNRKISIVDDTASKLKPPPSPAKNPISNILYITNLVRPFTVKQLKELLERTGKIQEEGFWTDRIKSKCYVQYETQEEAEATRNALHGVQWPIGNGKKLMIDFATEQDMQNAKNPPAPPPAPPVPETKPPAKENLEPVENKVRTEEKPSKEVEKKRSEGPVREWDIGKKDVRRDRSRSRERSRKHRRSPSPSEDFISRKQRKAEESVPQKLMDDLFLKTKSTPSIYWQPLSPEEISMKQQQRLIRMEEHKRRMEENSRMKGRDMGRGAFRRRYD